MPEFRFVPFGATAPPDWPDGGVTSCDGLVEGARFHLSHWPGNATPSRLKADTSTESALRFAAEVPGDGSLVVNNHFDVDGALSVLALLRPEVALAHATLFVAAAEVGDFDEWPKDERGIWLAAAVSKLTAGRDESGSYDRVIAELPAIVPNLSAREDLWGERVRALRVESDRVAQGKVAILREGPIAILVHGRGEAEVDAVAAFRALPTGVSRLLWAFERSPRRFEYRYEMPRYSWADTVVRPQLDRPGKNALAVALGGSWALKGEGLGMTGLIRTQAPIEDPPVALARSLLERERELGTL